MFLQSVRDAVREHPWEVIEDTWLSTFSFESLVIFQDLKVMVDVALQNGIIAAFARAGVPPTISECLPEELDSLPPEKFPFCVLPTDSSQLAAATLGISGCHLVIG